MYLEYTVFSIDQSREYHSDIYQYWIILSGRCDVCSEEKNIRVYTHDLLEIPAGCKIHIQCDSPVGIGCISLFDFFATNHKIKYVPASDVEILLKVFLFALDISGISHPNHGIIMSIVNQLMMEFLLSENSQKVINPCVEEFLKNITNHYFNVDFDLNLAIKKTGYSPSHFRKIFKETVGVSPNTFLNQRRIERAKSLMRQKEDMSIKSIAQESGFEDADYFSRFFKKTEGMSPSEYIKMIKESRTKQ